MQGSHAAFNSASRTGCRRLSRQTATWMRWHMLGRSNGYQRSTPKIWYRVNRFHIFQDGENSQMTHDDILTTYRKSKKRGYLILLTIFVSESQMLLAYRETVRLYKIKILQASYWISDALQGTARRDAGEATLDADPKVVMNRETATHKTQKRKCIFCIDHLNFRKKMNFSKKNTTHFENQLLLLPQGRVPVPDVPPECTRN